MSAARHLSPQFREFLENREPHWSFDVMTSNHDLLKEGKTEPYRSRIVLSKEEFPDHDKAVLTAAQWGMAGKGDRMTTAVYPRF